MSKGSRPRPYSVPRREFEDQWEKTFGRKEPKTDHDRQQDRSNQPDKKDAKYNDNKG